MKRMLPRTETALEECRAHLEISSSYGTPIESYLTNHIAVLLCSELETTVRELVHEHAFVLSEDPVADFVRKFTKNIVRNAKHSEIKDVVGGFGTEYKEAYDLHVRLSIGDGGILRIANTVSHRDDVAHRIPQQLSFVDVDMAYQAAEKIVEAVATTLADRAPLIPGE